MANDGFDMMLAPDANHLLPDEAPHLLEEIDAVVGPEWLHARNAWLAGRAPVDLIGTPEETIVRDLVRSIKAADFS